VNANKALSYHVHDAVTGSETTTVNILQIGNAINSQLKSSTLLSQTDRQISTPRDRHTDRQTDRQ